MDMVLTDDLTIRLASPLFYEKGCIATWGFCVPYRRVVSRR
jgi:hypothetical protein